jgi:hypothetical protein
VTDIRSQWLEETISPAQLPEGHLSSDSSLGVDIPTCGICPQCWNARLTSSPVALPTGALFSALISDWPLICTASPCTFFIQFCLGAVGMSVSVYRSPVMNLIWNQVLLAESQGTGVYVISVVCAMT